MKTATSSQSRFKKQTCAGQRTRFKAFVVVGDNNGHVGIGVKCSKEVANAIRGGIIVAKLCVIPVRRGYWGNKIGKPHTVPCKVTGKCGSVTVRMVPTPRGSGIVAARVPKKVLQFAGIDNVFTSSRGSTKTLGNFVKDYKQQRPSQELVAKYLLVWSGNFVIFIEVNQGGIYSLLARVFF